MNPAFTYPHRKGIAAAVLLLGTGALLFRLGTQPSSSQPQPVSQQPATFTAIATTTASARQADTSLAQYNERPNAAIPQSTAAPANPATEALVPGCSLRFSFAPAAETVETGGNISYAITVRNGGTGVCKNVSFSIYYSDNESFVSATPRPTASNYYWSIGDMASGKQFQVALVTQEQSVSQPYQVSNEACATGDNSPDVCPENLIFVGPAGSSAAAAALPAPPPSDILPLSKAPGESGIWVWESPDQMTPAYVSDMIAALKQYGFNAAYITVDDYLDIASLPDGPDRTAKSQAYMKALSDIVSQANAAGIAVDAEGGDMDWAEPDNNWKGYALIDFVSAYNQAYPQAKLRGFQYDVESYLLPAYNDDTASVLLSFVQFIDASAARMKDVDAAFSVVIPHFYDDQQAWTPSFVYNGKNAYTLTHLLDVLQQKPGSTLIVMAYRNFFSGDNGTEQISQAEVTEAAQGNYSTKIIVAQETGDVQPPYVTFHGESKADLFAAIQDIRTAFGSYSSFGGIAVDYLEPFLKLQ